MKNPIDFFHVPIAGHARTLFYPDGSLSLAEGCVMQSLLVIKKEALRLSLLEMKTADKISIILKKLGRRKNSKLVYRK